MKENNNSQTKDNRLYRHDNGVFFDFEWNKEYGYTEIMRVIFVK